jgi:hypothetical protein
MSRDTQNACRDGAGDATNNSKHPDDFQRELTLIKGTRDNEPICVLFRGTVSNWELNLNRN